MMLINPKADIPIIQLSVLTSASPAQHFAMGRALAPLRDSNIAIIGSGMPTLHNLRKMFSGAFNERQVQIRHKAWVQSLTSTIAIENATERGTKLESWREWEGSIDAHPQGGEDHFLPLIVCAGAGGDGKGVIFADKTMGLEQHTFYWT
jgi:aromatic ring-opening dioxygenase catalytic subunit (LigB family)